MTGMAPNEQPGAQQLDLLQHAFRLFGEAAGNLEGAYRTLTARVAQLDLELAERNEALRVNLQEKEEIRSHLASILESLTTGVIVADREGRIVQSNQAAERLLGQSRSRIQGRDLIGLLRAAGLGRPEYPLAAPNGIPLSLSRAVLRNDRGEAAGSIALLHDISDVRRLEERLQRRDRLAAMGEMVGRIAHEIRNPLGSVELFASMLRQDLAGDPERQRYAEHISVAVQAMDRLLSNLLTYTKPHSPRLEWHAPEPLLRETLAMAAHATTRAGVDVRLRLDPAVGMLRCDAAQLKQVLLNLALNAVQAMSAGGTLTVTLCRQPEGEDGRSVVRIGVADTGSGIEQVHLTRIFDPFFTTRDEGTGLGLAIVHAIVDAHHGRVEVESDPGRGSTFTVVLPSDGSAGSRSAGGDRRPAARSPRGAATPMILGKEAT